MIFFLFYNFVIFVLSTIVPITDCCSSRVLLTNAKHVRSMDTRPLLLPLKQNNDGSSESQQWEISTHITNHHRHIHLHHHHHHRHYQRQDSSAENSNENNHSKIADDQEKLDDGPEYTNILWRKCPPKMDIEFCLNGGQCFDYPISNDSILSCRCPDSFGGERCELKNIDFNHPILYPRVQQVALANVYLAPVLIFFLACLIVYILGLKMYVCFSKHYLFRGEIHCYRNSLCPSRYWD